MTANIAFSAIADAEHITQGCCKVHACVRLLLTVQFQIFTRLFEVCRQAG